MSLSPSHKSTLKEIAAKLLSLAEDEPKTENTTHAYPEGIVAFKGVASGIIYNIADGIIAYQRFCHAHLKEEPISTIYSVKNSAGEILTVNQKTEQGTIKYFNITDNMIVASIE